MATADTNVHAQSLAAGQASGQVPVLGRGSSARRKVVGRMGAWQLVRQIGEGTLTRVYLARPADAPQNEQGSTAPYAVKALRREWWSEPRAIEAQRREAWIGGRLSHPNLAPVLSASVTAPPYYVVMPYLSGETAERLLATEEKIPLPTALWIARQVAQALSALHASLGMVHGDVKPANLLVGPDGHTTLLDLGFCQTTQEARGWADRPVLGTLRYMAPERLTSATSVDTRSDLYSLGVTLYELIAGRPPFESHSPEVLIKQHREERPMSLEEARSGTPPRVSRFVERLLAKNPLRRPGSPQEAADELVGLEIECFGLR